MPTLLEMVCQTNKVSICCRAPRRVAKYTCTYTRTLLFVGDNWLSSRDFDSSSDSHGGPQIDPHDNWIVQREQVRHLNLRYDAIAIRTNALVERMIDEVHLNGPAHLLHLWWHSLFPTSPNFRSAGARERMLRYANLIFMEWGEGKLSRYGKPLTEMIKVCAWLKIFWEILITN